MSAINIIQRVARKLLTQNQPKGVITIPNRMTAEAKAGEIAATLQRAGLSMNRFDEFITSETDLIRILNQIEAFEKKNLAESIQSGIRNTESAKIFNIEGQSLDPNKPIIGGTQTGKELSPELSERLRGTNVDRIKQKIADKKIESDEPPPGSRGGDEDIAAPVQSSEESLRDMMIAENKKTINKIKQRQKMLAEAIDNQSPSLSGDRKVDAELVAEDLAERMGLVYDDMPTKERLKLYDEAYQALTKKKFDPPEDLATGGRVGLKFGTGKRFLQRVFGKERFEEMKSRDPEMYVGLLEVVDMYRKRDKEGLKMYLQKFLPHMDDEAIEAFIKGSDGTEGLVGELIRLGSGRDYAGKLEMIKRAQEMRKLDNLEVTDDMKRKPNADGGIMRLGLKEGSGMTRRTFLKLLGGLASIPIIGKIVKPLKTVKGVKNVPIIKTDNVPGKPEWFDQLVNKVIIEGDDVTKQLATVEREIVHTKKINNTDEVTVYQDLNTNSVRVEYKSPNNMMEEQVDLMYKRTPPDEGSPQASSEFEVAESGFVGRADGPDDYFIDAEEVGGQSIKDLDSDVSALKEYATGQKPTMKEIVQKMKRKEKVKKLNEGDLDAQSDYITARQGDAYDYDDYASGGIARMLGE